MLLRRLLGAKDLLKFSKSLKQVRYSSQAALESDRFDRSFKLRLTANEKKKPTREPFAKNLFFGKVDTEFLAYPEAQSHSRHHEFEEWIKQIEKYLAENVDMREIDRTSTIDEKIFDDLYNLGVFKAAISETYGGLGLNYTEYARLVETLAVAPVLATYLINHYTAVNIITKFGKESQKADVMKKIASNEIIPTVCVSEPHVNMMTDMPDTTATMMYNNNSFSINGTKSHVVNAKRANVFLVLAKAGDFTMQKHDDLKRMSIFMVPGDSEGIIKEEEPSLSLHGADMCTVKFKDVEVDMDNQLMEDIRLSNLYSTIFGEGKCFVGAQLVGILRKFLNHLIIEVEKTKNFTNIRDTNDSIHETIARTAASLYAMESVLYLTTGMKDNFENQDIVLEEQLVNIYCVNACKDAIFNGVQGLGLAGYSKNSPFEQLLRDALMVSVYDRPVLDAKIYAALLGVEHMSKDVAMAKEIRERRNPTAYPKFVASMQDLFTSGRHKNLGLYQFVHPTLVSVTETLELAVHEFKNHLFTHLVWDGPMVVNQHMKLRRVTDVLINIYTTFAVCARASRAYCIGLRDSDQDMHMATVFAYDTHVRIKGLMEQMEDGSWSNGDECFKAVADNIFSNKKYFAMHPMDRTF